MRRTGMAGLFVAAAVFGWASASVATLCGPDVVSYRAEMTLLEVILDGETASTAAYPTGAGTHQIHSDALRYVVDSESFINMWFQ